jgi:hypothetical protein
VEEAYRVVPSFLREVVDLELQVEEVTPVAHQEDLASLEGLPLVVGLVAYLEEHPVVEEDQEELP